MSEPAKKCCGTCWRWSVLAFQYQTGVCDYSDKYWDRDDCCLYWEGEEDEQAAQL